MLEIEEIKMGKAKKVEVTKEEIEDAKSMWIGFTKMTTFSIVAIVAILALMAIFLV